MSELLPCPFCQTAEEFPPRIVRVRMSHPSYGPHGVAVHIFGGIEDDKCSYAVICDNCGSQGQIRKEAENAIEAWNTRYSKYPLNVTKQGYGGLVAALSPTLDRLRDSGETEADLGEIEHNGEKVMVKIKVVRGE